MINSSLTPFRSLHLFNQVHHQNSGGGGVDQEIQDMITKYFKGDATYKHLLSMDNAGDITLSASVSSPDAELLGDMIDDVNQKYDGVLIEGGKSFTIKLRAHVGAGKGDFHLMSRDQAIAAGVINKNMCGNGACRVGGTNNIVSRGTHVNGGQYAHEIFHALGWSPGGGGNHIPDPTDIMHSRFGGAKHGLKAHHYWGIRNFFIGK